MSSSFFGHFYGLLLIIFIRIAKTTSKTQWVLIHYHKTGHDLVQTVTDLIIHRTNASYWNKKDTTRNNISPFIKDFHQNIIELHAPDMPFDWNEQFGRLDTNVKIVHFVREPYDMILSGYLYHSQNPSPVSEKWERQLDFQPCMPSSKKSHLRQDQRHYDEELASAKSNLSNLSAHISTVRKLCNELYNKYNHGRTMSYDHILWNAKDNADVFDGIRIEASRSIVSIDGGDLLRMAANAVRERQSGFKLSKRFFLADFSLSNKERYNTSVYGLFSFLMAPSCQTGAGNSCEHNVMNLNEEFWKTLTPREATNSLIERIFRTARPVSTQSAHNLTSDMTPLHSTDTLALNDGEFVHTSSQSSSTILMGEGEFTVKSRTEEEGHGNTLSQSEGGEYEPLRMISQMAGEMSSLSSFSSLSIYRQYFNAFAPYLTSALLISTQSASSVTTLWDWFDSRYFSQLFSVYSGATHTATINSARPSPKDRPEDKARLTQPLAKSYRHVATPPARNTSVVTKKASSSKHVTAALMDRNTRESYMVRLHSDPVLSPVIDLVKRALEL